MIKPEELRIGNWILFEEDGPMNPYQVARIDAGSIRGGAITIYRHDNNFGECLAPIPLTTEILDKCRLEKVEGDEYDMFKIPPHYLIGVSEGIVSFVILIDSQNKLVWNGLNPPYWRFKYLHQLQNLYFALTGIELEYKP